jgi:hypothetical protein
MNYPSFNQELDTSHIYHKTYTFPYYSLKGIRYGKIIDIYDDNNCKINIYVLGSVYKYKVYFKECNKIKEELLGKIVKLNCEDFDEYGRLFAEIIR